MDLIARRWIGIARHVRHSTALEVGRIHGHRDLRILLKIRQREEVADSAPTRTESWSVVPDYLVSDLPTRGFQSRPAARQHVRTGSREIDVRFTVGNIVCRTVVTRGA